VFSIIGHPTPEAVDHRPWLRRSFGLAIQLSNSTAVLSEASAVAAEEVFARRPIVLSPGIRLDGFPMDGAPRTGPPRILFPAYAEDPRKGLQTLLLAMPAILRRHPDARLILGGPGRHEHALESLEPTDRDLVTDALDVSGPGQLEDVPARYRAATVTVLPSVDEAFGLVLVESLASGTPIVCTTSGGPAEIVSPEVGWAVAPRDPQALADAVCHAIVLASQPDTAAKCRSRARRWDWTEVVGSAHEQVLQSVARRRSLS
jgi:phosphatidylinositol alpha-mannosyltransferase